MNLAMSVLTVTLLLNAIIGLVVIFAQPYRKQNQGFFLLTLVFTTWGFAVLAIMLSPDAEAAEMRIRVASYVSALLPVAFHLLCRSIVHEKDSYRKIYLGLWPTLTASQAIGVMTFSRFFLEGVKVLDHGPAHMVPVAEYGHGFALFAAYFVITCFGLVMYFLRSSRKTEGTRRAELQFILLGLGFTITFAIIFNLIMPMLTGSSQWQQYGPASIVGMNFIFAYGLATRRIMEVAAVIRRAAAFSLLLTYLVCVYALVFLAARGVQQLFVEGWELLPHMLAALTTAFTLSPVNGLLQSFTNRLFARAPVTDVGRTLREANLTLQSVTTLPDMITRFSDLIRRSLGSDEVRVLLYDTGESSLTSPLSPEAAASDLQLDSPLVRSVLNSKRPLIAEMLKRRRLTPRLMQARQQMERQGIALASGIWRKGRMQGLLLLGPRIGGRIYSITEQRIIELLSNELAVAIENAKLYTQVENSRIHNEMLMDNLVSGVAAINAEGRITTLNREAQRITGLNDDKNIGEPADCLPAPLGEILQTTLESGSGCRDRELLITNHNDETIPLLAGSTIVKGHNGNTLGALLVVSDQTAIRKLELQVRRSDRLASLGTLAAGMAHELKNPLVTLKTFTDLLPTRYGDEDFRKTFINLAGREVRRIDSLVNQLLSFARPAEPRLERTSLHSSISHSVQLVRQQLDKKRIDLDTGYSAERDVIHGDAGLLEQAFVNIFLNAMAAMNPGGRLVIATRCHTMPGDGLGRKPQPAIETSVSDNGAGIPAKHIARIFDPFFTTKHEGTGLGLSVTHGIIQEHNGLIHVESTPGRGATFRVTLPLADERAAADNSDGKELE